MGEFTLTYAWILLIAGILAVVISQMSKGKSSTRKTWTWIGVALLAVGILGISGSISGLDFLNQTAFGKSTTIGGTTINYAVAGAAGAAGSACPPGSVEDVTVKLQATDKYTSTAIGGSHAYRLNGGPVTVLADAGTFTASAGDAVEILWTNGSSGSNYFSDKSTETLACGKGAVTITRQLVQNGTLTIEVFNEEGNLIDTAGENETLSTGDVVTLEAKLKGTYQRGFPYGGVIVVEYNNTDYDDVIAQFGGAKVSVPDFYTVSSTANIAKAYSVPSIMSNQILTGAVVLDTKDVNPGDSNDPTLKFYPYNYYIDEKNGGAFVGPASEDENSAQLSPTHVTTFTLNVD